MYRLYRSVSVGDTPKSLPAQRMYRNKKKSSYKFLLLLLLRDSDLWGLSRGHKKAIHRYNPCAAVDLGVSVLYRCIVFVIHVGITGFSANRRRLRRSMESL